MNFIDAFVEWAGESECPKPYLEWAALSLLAACCGTRIYLPYRIGNVEIKRHLNMYVMLVGPSCNFKSYAIMLVEEILRNIDHSERLNLYSGHLTHSGMYDHMQGTRKKRLKDGTYTTIDMPWAGQIYLLCDELANDIGSAEYADLFVRSLTKLYHGSAFDDRTRTNGHVHLEGYSVNALFGTTLDWLILAINAATLLSGFFGRLATVHCQHSDKRVYPPDAKRPKNWGTLFDYLTSRTIELLNLAGTIKLTEEAVRVDRAWYLSQSRPAHNDPTIQSSQRQHDMALKIASLLAIANHTFTVDDELLVAGQDKTDDVVKWQREILPSIQKGKGRSPHDELLNAILAVESMPHAKLFSMAYHKFGIRANEMDSLLRTWMESGIVEEEKRPRSRGGKLYKRTQR